MAAPPRRNASRARTQGPSVVRRGPDAPKGLRDLPPEVEDLASGRSEYLRRPRRPQGRIEDPRVAGLIPGVPNHEARRVFDARVERLRTAMAANDDSALEQLLYEASRLGVWRARNVTGLDALCEGVLGLPIARGEALVAQAAETYGDGAARLPEAAIALWMRSEAALLDHCDEAAVHVRVEEGQLLVMLSVPLSAPERAADALAAVGHKARSLGEALAPDRRTERGGERGERTAPPRSGPRRVTRPRNNG